MRTELTCSIRGSSSTISGTDDKNLSHQLQGAGKNMASATVLTDDSSYAQGKASYQISISVKSGSEGLTEPPDAAEYTSSCRVQTSQSLIASPPTAVISGNLTLVSAVTDLGAALSPLTLTVGGKTFYSANQTTSFPVTIPIPAVTSAQPFSIEMDVKMTCNSGSEAEAEGEAIF